MASEAELREMSDAASAAIRAMFEARHAALHWKCNPTQTNATTFCEALHAIYGASNRLLNTPEHVIEAFSRVSPTMVNSRGTVSASAHLAILLSTSGIHLLPALMGEAGEPEPYEVVDSLAIPPVDAMLPKVEGYVDHFDDVFSADDELNTLSALRMKELAIALSSADGTPHDKPKKPGGSRTAARDAAWLKTFEDNGWTDISEFAASQKPPVTRSTMSKALNTTALTCAPSAPG